MKKQFQRRKTMGKDLEDVCGLYMKEVYWEIKINKPGPRFLPELSLSGPAKVVYFDLPIYFLHEQRYQEVSNYVKNKNI